MIRPITLITAGLAVLSGLYLYHSKNAVLMLDRKIEKIARDTIAVGEQTRLLHAEWTLLNDPERLRQFSDVYLTLKPLAPTQFTRLNDLASRLPAPRAPEDERPTVTIETVTPAPNPDAATPSETVPALTEEPAPVVIAEDVLPIPPLPVPPPPVPAARSAPPLQLATTPAQPAPGQAGPAPASVARGVEPVAARPPVQAQAPVTRAPEAKVATSVRPPLQGPVPQPGYQPAPASSAIAPLPLPRPAAPIQTAANTTRPTSPATAAPSAPPAAARFAPPARQQPATYQSPPAPTPAYGGSMLGGAQRAAPLPLPRPMPVYAPVQDGGG